jgi:hypothetical protein
MAVEIPGIGAVTATAPSRVPVRVRALSVTLSAWRLDATSPRGAGTLVLADHGGASWYRGDGVFLGWPQDRLGAAWRALLPPAERTDLDIPQLG